MTRAERFDAKVEPEPNTGCWLWSGADSGKGYGKFWDGERLTLAHRYAYERHVGPIPDGLQIDHLCRVRCCVNPDHLEAVTQQENVRRGEAGKYLSDRSHCQRGHAYDAFNTIRERGRRVCRSCKRAWERGRRARQRVEERKK